MKILYAIDYPEGGTWNVASPLIPLLKVRDHSVEVCFLKDLANLGADGLEGEWDVVHAWNLRAGAPFRHSFPLVQTVNSFMPAHAPAYMQAAREADFVHTHSPHVAQLLHNLIGKPATFIPVAFDHKRCMPPTLPFPEEFTLGWLGSDRSFKNFETAREIARFADMPYVEWDLDELRPWEQVKTEFFPKISCYLMASFNDAGPLPPQEALLFGRPVVSTCIGMMTMIVKEGFNGRFFDGSVPHGVSVVREVKANLPRYTRRGAAIPVHPEDVVPLYEDLYQRACQ